MGNCFNLFFILHETDNRNRNTNTKHYSDIDFGYGKR